MKQNSHPRGLRVLFLTEMWERFSYYGMRAILVLFMTKMLAFDDKFASGMYGNFTAVVYLTPLIGGYISDRYWGNTRSIMTGGVLMAIGQFLLFVCASLIATNLGIAKIIFVVGLIALVVGNGFFKPNISTMVNQLYPANDKRVDAGFSIFYMGINLGAFFSPLICGSLAEKIDFRWGFFAAGVGMTIGLFVFNALRAKYVVTVDGKEIGGKPDLSVQESAESSQISGDFSLARILKWAGVYILLWFVFMQFAGFNWISTLVFATSIAAAGFIITDPSLTKVEQSRITVIYIAAVFVVFFWSAFEQAGASLTLFADKNTDRQVMGFTMPTSWFQSVNPLVVIFFAPVFAQLWTWLGARNKEPASPLKQALGLGLLALGYLVIAIGVKGISGDMKASMVWLLVMYLLHSFGELCLSPIGLSMVSRLSPARLASLLMGVWFLANAMANDFAGMLSKLLPAKNSPTNFFGYSIVTLNDFFMIFVMLSGFAAIVMFVMSQWLLKKMHGLK